MGVLKNGVFGVDRGIGMVYGVKLVVLMGCGVVVVDLDVNWEGIIVWGNFWGWVVFWKVKLVRVLVNVIFVFV